MPRRQIPPDLARKICLWVDLPAPVDLDWWQRLAMEGVLVDKSQALVLDALTRLAAAADGLPLLSGKGTVGLCAANAAGKQTAEFIKSDALARVVRTQTKHKSVHEIYALSEKGLAYLLEKKSPRFVLEALVGALQANSARIDTLLNEVRAGQESMVSLKAYAAIVLQDMERPQQGIAEPIQTTTQEPLLTYLKCRQDTGTLDDCPLPELYRHLQARCPSLTVGQYHDLLRRLNQEAALYLHPWTGPLYELPEPALALLVGHEVAYYASLRLRAPLAA
jgi:hypothetical protein